MIRSVKILLSLLTIFNLLFINFLPIYAEEMPNGDQVATSITNQATSQTSTITTTPTPDTSTPAPTSSPNPSTESQISNTGDNNNTNTNSQTSDQTQVNNQNNTTVDQTAKAEANTGNNEASRNISIGGNAGVITTGDATVNTQAEVNAGQNTTKVNNEQTGSNSFSGVTNTGNNLTTSTSDNSNTTTLVNNGNETVVNQTIDASANTGGNVADRNISIGGSAGVITTGSASTNTSFLVTAGGNVTLIGGESNGNGPGNGASIILANNGDSSRFTTSSTTNNYLIVTNENRALLSQICDTPIEQDTVMIETSKCTANTGDNVSNRNIGNGSDAGIINTGDATLNLSMEASANNNNTNINQPESGSATTNTNALNTGDNLNLTTSTSNNNSTVINNTNESTIQQIAQVYANTGNNQANRNISLGGNAGVITTGDATVNINMTVDTNNNKNTINNSGNNGGSNKTNNTNAVNTGDNTAIETNSTNNNKTIIENLNIIHVIQQVFVWANTGFNQALRNIGEAAGIIKTGPVTITVNAKVKANENINEIGKPSVKPTQMPSPTPTTAPTTTPSPTSAPLPTSTPAPTQQPSQTSTVLEVTTTPTPTSTTSSTSLVEGASASQLPPTGTELFMSALGYLIIMLAGVYLTQYSKSYNK